VIDRTDSLFLQIIQKQFLQPFPIVSIIRRSEVRKKERSRSVCNLELEQRGHQRIEYYYNNITLSYFQKLSFYSTMLLYDLKQEINFKYFF